MGDTVITTLRLSVELVGEMDREAARRGMSRNALVVESLREYLGKVGKTGESVIQASKVEKRRDRKAVDEPVRSRATCSTSENVVESAPKKSAGVGVGSCPVCGGELIAWGSGKRCGKCQRNW